MYDFLENIRFRTCVELTFLININKNTIFTLKTETFKFLEKKLRQGLSKENLKNNDIEFIEFIKKLEKQEILRLK
ncbi:MAG: hypothetical protein KH846_10765 [Leptotrichia wadei]|jgi:hypothetical protein|uniref:hypothetical protein n=1 Tax=Leptotrichia wadei TaxID=157687 RepID=UPI0026118253|nr:hypothetical protein [Leptotrichia wadei]MBS6020639.1 hypothetical protein [Leptotrichia wadei]